MNKKRLIITGAGGWLARDVSLRAKADGWHTIGITSNTRGCFKDYDEVKCNDLLDTLDTTPNDLLVHCAFSRKSIPRELSGSISFSRHVFSFAIERQLAGIVNISSQGVYGHESKFASETDEPCPDYPYALAKCAAEELLEGMTETASRFTPHTSLRVASLVGATAKSISQNILTKFIRSAMQGEPINIQGGEQRFSFLDVRDASEMILGVCSFEPKCWDKVYNVGSGIQISIIELANEVVRVISNQYELPPVPINVDTTTKMPPVNVGMNCDRLFTRLGWRPQPSFEKTIRDISSFISTQNHLKE